MNKSLKDTTGSPALRMTPQRRAILDEFQGDENHFSADEVYVRVRAKLPSISLGTVYRNLDILAQTGQVVAFDVGSGQKLYDGGLHRHYHVRCVDCGRVCDISAGAVGDLNAAASGHGFEIISHQLTFEGVCDSCSKARKGSDNTRKGG